jgi:hypothetical protein
MLLMLPRSEQLFATSIGMAYRQSAWSLTLTTIVAMVALQMGYLIGGVARAVTVAIAQEAIEWAAGFP